MKDIIAFERRGTKVIAKIAVSAGDEDSFTFEFVFECGSDSYAALLHSQIARQWGCYKHNLVEDAYIKGLSADSVPAKSLKRDE